MMYFFFEIAEPKTVMRHSGTIQGKRDINRKWTIKLVTMSGLQK